MTWSTVISMSGRIAAASLAEFSSVPAALVRIVIAPWAMTALYLLLAAGGNLQRLSPESSWIAGVAVGSTAAVVSGAMLALQDQMHGTVPYLIVATRGSVAAWLGRAAVLAFVGTASALSGSLFLPALGGQLNQPSTAWNLVAVVLAGVTSVSVGYVVGLVSQMMKDPLVLANIVELFLPAVMGAIAPIALLPAPVQAIALALPGTTLISGLREWARHGELAQLIAAFGTAAILGGVWLVCGVVLATLVRKSRRTPA
ncbi:MAG TPA: hypothetical protein VK139_08090 [Microbacteriaceae bacterium]|nr:hypothetical protein [Microbacteriaceae bacterium]